MNLVVKWTWFWTFHILCISQAEALRGNLCLAIIFPDREREKNSTHMEGCPCIYFYVCWHPARPPDTWTWGGSWGSPSAVSAPVGVEEKEAMLKSWRMDGSRIGEEDWITLKLYSPRIPCHSIDAVWLTLTLILRYYRQGKSGRWRCDEENEDHPTT